MNIDNNVIKKLQNTANLSIIDHKLAAAIISHNKIIGRPYCNIPKYRPYIKQEGTIHAEMNTIMHLYNNNTSKRKSKIDIIVIRINRYGFMCNARPCYNCLMSMKQMGIRRVYYSINADEIIYENIKDMISIQITSYNRLISHFNRSLGIIKYYESVLLEIFPSSIKMINLINFIKYNFNNVLPQYKIIIKNNIVIIKNSNNITIKTAFIIF